MILIFLCQSFLLIEPVLAIDETNTRFDRACSVESCTAVVDRKSLFVGCSLAHDCLQKGLLISSSQF
jgi:hypothetical protein